MPEFASVNTVTKPEEFVALKDEWNELVDSDERATIFQKWEFQYHTWRFNDDSISLCTLLVRDSYGRLIGCAPLGTHTLKIGIVPVRILEFASVRYCDYANFIIRSGCETEALDALADWFRKNFHKWDVVRLRPLREDSLLLENEDLFLKKTGRPYTSVQYSVAPHLKLDPEWPSFDKALSTSSGRSTRTKVRKLFKRLDATFVDVKGTLEMSKAVNRLMDLHQLRMSQKNQAGAFARPKVREAFLDLMSDLHCQGLARVHTIHSEDKTIASICTMEFRNTVSFFQSGFDPEFEPLSPGTVMHALRINEAINDKAVEYDFLDGAEPYKFSWSNGQRSIYAVDFSTGSWRARLYYLWEKTRIRMSHSERIRTIYLKFRSGIKK